MWSAEHYYRYLRGQGWRPEQARSVLPNSLKTEIVMTANLREWRHFFKLRTAAAAHPQMREIACPLLAQFRAAMPILFDDVGTTESGT
jgi:thymidylate synthase (FAD)